MRRSLITLLLVVVAVASAACATTSADMNSAARIRAAYEAAGYTVTEYPASDTQNRSANMNNANSGVNNGVNTDVNRGVSGVGNGVSNGMNSGVNTDVNRGVSGVGNGVNTDVNSGANTGVVGSDINRDMRSVNRRGVSPTYRNRDIRPMPYHPNMDTQDNVQNRRSDNIYRSRRQRSDVNNQITDGTINDLDVNRGVNNNVNNGVNNNVNSGVNNNMNSGVNNYVDSNMNNANMNNSMTNNMNNMNNANMNNGMNRNSGSDIYVVDDINNPLNIARNNTTSDIKAHVLVARKGSEVITIFIHDDVAMARNNQEAYSPLARNGGHMIKQSGKLVYFGTDAAVRVLEGR